MKEEVFMEELYIHNRYITDTEKKLLLRKGFKLTETRHVPSGLYEGDIFTFSLPKDLRIYSTTTNNTFLVCYKGSEVCRIYYPVMKTYGMLSVNMKSNYWK